MGTFLTTCRSCRYHCSLSCDVGRYNESSLHLLLVFLLSVLIAQPMSGKLIFMDKKELNGISFFSFLHPFIPFLGHCNICPHEQSFFKK